MHYKEIWSYFLAVEAKEFEDVRKLSIKNIKRIGVKKFIKANDWHTEEDVAKWRTDLYDVVPCPTCNNDFGILDITMGLCEKCRKRYDLGGFYKLLSCTKTQESQGKLVALFLSSKELRDVFRSH